jgi:hypothetical protein
LPAWAGTTIRRDTEGGGTETAGGRKAAEAGMEKADLREGRMMDDDALKAAFQSHTEGKTHFTRRMVIAMAKMFDATPRQIVIRCELLGLCKAGSWDWFVANGGFTSTHFKQFNADL